MAWRFHAGGISRAYPIPQTPGSTNNYVFASPQNQDPRHWDFRADEVLTDKQNLFPVYRRLGCLRREQYANIEGPKIAELSPNEPKATIEQAISYQSIPLIPGPLSGSAGGPEKAGVGGSIPSLATTFSTTYKPSKPQFRSSSFQFLACRTSLTE